MSALRRMCGGLPRIRLWANTRRVAVLALVGGAVASACNPVLCRGGWLGCVPCALRAQPRPSGISNHRKLPVHRRGRCPLPHTRYVVQWEVDVEVEVELEVEVEEHQRQSHIR